MNILISGLDTFNISEDARNSLSTEQVVQTSSCQFHNVENDIAIDHDVQAEKIKPFT